MTVQSFHTLLSPCQPGQPGRAWEVTHHQGSWGYAGDNGFLSSCGWMSRVCGSPQLRLLLCNEGMETFADQGVRGHPGWEDKPAGKSPDTSAASTPAELL